MYYFVKPNTISAYSYNFCSPEKNVVWMFFWILLYNIRGDFNEKIYCHFQVYQPKWRFSMHLWRWILWWRWYHLQRYWWVYWKSNPMWKWHMPQWPGNVCFKKTGTKRSSVLLLRFVPVFLKQTLHKGKKKKIKGKVDNISKEIYVTTNQFSLLLNSIFESR